MKRNVGTTDRIICVFVGIVIIGLGIIFKSWWGIIGILPLITAFVGYCLPYALLGISTCKVKRPEN